MVLSNSQQSDVRQCISFCECELLYCIILWCWIVLQSEIRVELWSDALEPQPAGVALRIDPSHGLAVPHKRHDAGVIRRGGGFVGSKQRQQQHKRRGSSGGRVGDIDLVIDGRHPPSDSDDSDLSSGGDDVRPLPKPKRSNRPMRGAAAPRARTGIDNHTDQEFVLHGAKL